MSQWNRDDYTEGADSSLHGTFYNSNTATKRLNHITMGSVYLANTEPTYRQTTVNVELTKGGKHTHVAWPGGQVNVGSSGITSPVSDQIHGLWEAPLPGQQVLIGYSNGDSGDPVVINKYSYNALQNPIYEAAHNLPLTQKSHGPLDIVLGHFTGSYIALRGTLPIPGHIEINALTTINIESVAATTIKSVSLSIETQSLITIKNDVENLKTLMNDLISTLVGLGTVGSPVAHILNATTISNLNAINTRFNLLLGS